MPSDFFTLMLDGRVPMKFRLIPPGEFRMGSRGMKPGEEPIHQVNIKQSFYIGVYPVTQLQWRTIVKTVPPLNDRADSSEPVKLDPDPSHFKGDERPVEQVGWHDAADWCRRLHRSTLGGHTVDDAGNSVQPGEMNLPTEAQWEYACRLTQTEPRPVCGDTEYHTGDGEAALSAAGWFGGNSDHQTHDVGCKKSNGIGLHDMHGNVWEWCRDAWSDDAYKTRIDGVTDPFVSAGNVGKSEDDAERVFRGGGWIYSAWFCRAAFRLGWAPVGRFWDRGFRVCLFFGPDVPSQQTGTGVTSEQESVDVARRDAAAESEDSGGDVTEVDLSNASLPKRSVGTKF